MNVQFDLRGFEGIDRALDTKIKAITDGVDKEMTAWTIEVSNRQKAYTPVNTSRLRSGNGFDVSKPLNKQLFNTVEYGPYVEFGTGGLVNVPAGLEDYALQFKGAGIRQVNMNAQPFFFRAFFEEQQNLIERIRNIIRE